MIAWAVVLTLWPVYAFPAEISGVYELREKGEVRENGQVRQRHKGGHRLSQMMDFYLSLRYKGA